MVTPAPAAASGPRPLARVGAELFAASFVVLFQELTLIRWLPVQVRVLAYFPNLILVSAFLGHGVGCLRAGGRSLRWLWPALLLTLALVAVALGNVVFTQNSASEHLWLLYHDLPKSAPVVGDVRPPIILFFVLSALSFVPLGQLVARRLGEFRDRGLALRGYACDLLGSLAGVVAFAAASFARTTPAAWFALLLAAGAALFADRRRPLLAYAACAATLTALVWHADTAQFYSPYYAISAQPEADGAALEITANGSLHQVACELARDRREDAACDPEVTVGYHLPYRLLPRAPRRVLVLGAGTGNDVAVALDEGAERVDAVEVDPVILALGDRHPDRPYASPRVRRFNNDARAFLQGTAERYDLIVFGTLDSMTRLSALSNVRLDNFVYTTECLEAAKARLAPGGGVVMYFMVDPVYIDARLEGMLARTFGAPPKVVAQYYFLFNRVYMAGPAFARAQLGPEAGLPVAATPLETKVELPSDDWPYLYLQRRGIDGFYLSLLAVFAAVAAAAVAFASRDWRRGLASGAADGQMFLLGFGFLLLEVKSVTALSLLWGATWLTSAVVFGAILFTALAATVLTELRPLPWRLGVGGLIVSLAAAYAVPLHALLRTNAAAKLGLSVAFAGVPVFFAAICFALVFRDREESGTALGWNLLGAVAGGLAEFAAMLFGNRALYLLALAAYAGVVLLRLRERKGRRALAEPR